MAFGQSTADIISNIIKLEHHMRNFIFLLILAFCLIGTGIVRAEESAASEMMHPIVGQMRGQANTVIMWHDTNDDGQADYRATYVFKAGKLHQVSKQFVPQEDSGNFEPRKMGVFNG